MELQKSGSWVRQSTIFCREFHIRHTSCSEWTFLYRKLNIIYLSPLSVTYVHVLFEMKTYELIKPKTLTTELSNFLFHNFTLNTGFYLEVIKLATYVPYSILRKQVRLILTKQFPGLHLYAQSTSFLSVPFLLISCKRFKYPSRFRRLSLYIPQLSLSDFFFTQLFAEF